MKKHLTLAVKIALVVGLLYILTQKGSISLHDTRRAFSRWEIMLPAVSLLFLNLFLGTIRWRWLLAAQGISLSFRRTLQLTMIGNFFNLALPGAVSGDFVKAFYISREIKVQRGFAFGSILFDRVAGLAALVLVSAGALAIGYSSAMGHSLFLAIRTFVTIAAICVVAFFGFLFLVREKHDPILKTLKRLESRFSAIGSIHRIYAGLRHYHGHRWTVCKVLLLSIVIHLIVGWCCFQFAIALGEAVLPLLPVYVVTPLGLLVTAIPVAPAGVGTGHMAFSAFFQLIGSARGADVFTLFAFCQILWGGVGGLVYLRFRGSEALPNSSTADANEVVVGQ